MKDDKNWISILKNYRLMVDAHFENDAQNWHIIGAELVSFSHESLDLFLTVTIVTFLVQLALRKT